MLETKFSLLRVYSAQVPPMANPKDSLVRWLKKLNGHELQLLGHEWYV